jgi:hypothetical protein
MPAAWNGKGGKGGVVRQKNDTPAELTSCHPGNILKQFSSIAAVSFSQKGYQDT